MIGKSLFLALFAISQFFLGQNYNSQYIKWGVSANFHKGSIVGVHDYSVGKYGGGLSLFADIPLVENDIFDSAYMYLEPQVEFTMGGERAKAETDKFGVQDYTNDYVAAMLYFKWFFHKGNMKRNTFLFLGPRVEYLVYHTKNVAAAYDAAYYPFNKDNTINKWGYGVSLGAGVRLGTQWEAFMRYDRGFSRVYVDNPKFTYNRMLCVGVNYFINNNWW